MAGALGLRPCFTCCAVATKDSTHVVYNGRRYGSSSYGWRAVEGLGWEEHSVGRVTFLGTGDSLNGERAQASLAVPLEGGETMLIDASSGTILLRQLEGAAIRLESVRHLLVTHRHFDHTGGLAPLLTALASVPEASLMVHATPTTLEALRELLELTIPGVEDWLGGRLVWSGLHPGKATQVGGAEVTPFEVDHGLECVGFRVEQGALTMVHAADTRYCPNVVEYSSDADLLAHEAYGLQDDAERAHALGHSTAAEAGRVARASGVRRLVLTHFRSGRFVDPRKLKAEAALAFGGPVEAACDLDAFDF
jgi:ribonuclease BN (tRNA processing enzyme)